MEVTGAWRCTPPSRATPNSSRHLIHEHITLLAGGTAFHPSSAVISVTRRTRRHSRTSSEPPMPPHPPPLPQPPFPLSVQENQGEEDLSLSNLIAPSTG